MRFAPLAALAALRSSSRTVLLAGLAVAAAPAALWFAFWIRQPAPVAAGDTTASEAASTEVSLVSLAPAKHEAAALKLATAELRNIQPLRTVPGRLDYDTSRHLRITAPVDAVVKEVYVRPGQAVEQGERLALLSSAEIGRARDELNGHLAELEIARREFARAEQIAGNVEQLLALLAQRPAWDKVEQQFSGKVLGEFRELICGSYSKLLLAEAALEGTSDLPAGVLSDRVLQERQSARQIAAALFGTTCETASFTAAQERDRCQAAVEHAERLVRISRERLATLLGPAASDENTAPEALNDFVLSAPRNGQLVELHAVAAMRTTAGTPLFAIADTRELWVSAEIHERDWAALQTDPQQILICRVPALGEQDLPAEVRFIGASVADQTRSVPLVATIQNPEGLLRPGLSAWVDVPLASPQPRLVVPASAVIRHETVPFVFVPRGERTYERRDIEIGLETRDWVEVTSGLEVGEQVVEQGVFYLKSELLLEREAD